VEEKVVTQRPLPIIRCSRCNLWIPLVANSVVHQAQACFSYFQGYAY